MSGHKKLVDEETVPSAPKKSCRVTFSDSESESDDSLALLEELESSPDGGRRYEGIENQDKYSLNDDIRNVEQSVLDHFHCGVVLDDGVCEMHRPSCRYCRCLADCPGPQMVIVCPLQWKELFEDKVNNPKKYHQIIQYAKLYHTIYSEGMGTCPQKLSSALSEGTVMYLYTEEVMAMCKTNKNYLSVDKTFHIGPCYVTMLVFRNQNLGIKADKDKRAPLMLGPVLLHFGKVPDDDYIPFFEHIKELCGITITEEETAKKFDKKTLEGIPREHCFLYESIKRSFGDNMNFCTRNDLPRGLHGKMKEEVTCYSKLRDLIKVLYELYKEDIKHVVSALNGRGKWCMNAHALEVMEKASSGNALKDFVAIELE